LPLQIQSLQQTIEQQQRQLKQLNKLEARLESTKEQLAQQQAQREALNAQLLLVKHEAAQAQEQLAAVQVRAAALLVLPVQMYLNTPQLCVFAVLLECNNRASLPWCIESI
jgi:septal ring factor EnvC (AmiA/AmiB activator)